MVHATMEPCIAINDSASRLAHALVDRYLDLLGLPRRAPSLLALREIVAAHLWRVPFENVSKLYYRRHDNWTALPDIERFLSGMERYHFGGTCYANNSHLCELLMSLGYDARLCGADMSVPDVHVAITVRLEGREYLVDGGYGSPFWEPMPLDLAIDLEILHGNERYVLKPRDADGCSRMEQYNDGVLRHAYRAKPASKTIADLASVIADSFRPDATFMNAVVAARFSPAYSVVIRNLKLVETRGSKSSQRTLRDREELVAAIETHFAIPPEITREALEGMGGFRDIFA
jgi:N-hydroxyarylamine O-acetyltransferase